MQQTNQYKLNLIESGDAFSATPLNENAEKLEAALAEQAETLAEQAEAIAAGVKCVVGSYSGTGVSGSADPNSLAFSFSPKFVMIWGYGAYNVYAIATYGNALRYFRNGSSGHSDLITTWGTNSLTWYNDDSSYGTAYLQLNHSGAIYYYLAVG